MIDSVKALTAVLSKPTPMAVLPISADPNFLRDLFFGSYEPEVFKVTPELQPFNRKVNQTHKSLEKTLSQEGRQKLEEYEFALSECSIAVTEQAYRAGVHAAVQMIMAGLSRPGTKRLAEMETNHEY